MSPELLIELYGYLGSTLVVVSMLMASVVKLRIVNTVGSIVSGTYALIIGSFPLALMNGCLIIINVYNLIRLLNTNRQYDMICDNSNGSYVRYFISRYMKDILCYFPDFSEDDIADNKVFVVFCNGDGAGIFIGKDMGNGEMTTVLDYATPAYRDCSVGKYLYASLPEYGVDTLIAPENFSSEHKSYLNKMGFCEENGVCKKHLH